MSLVRVQKYWKGLINPGFKPMMFSVFLSLRPNLPQICMEAAKIKDTLRPSSLPPLRHHYGVLTLFAQWKWLRFPSSHPGFKSWFKDSFIAFIIDYTFDIFLSKILIFLLNKLINWSDWSLFAYIMLVDTFGYK